MTLYVYDGTFEGLLSAIFTVYARRDDAVTITREATHDLAFGARTHLVTDADHSARVARRLGPETTRRLYFAFLSEYRQIENLILRYVRTLLGDVVAGPLDEAVLLIEQLARRVGVEVHRMYGFVRFEEQADGSFHAAIAPDSDVLRLIGPHFAERFPTQCWKIRDVRRQSTLVFDGDTLKLMNTGREASEASPQESDYQALWQTYFRATTIPERRNMKRHLRHVPRRYWVYLTEKSLQG